MYKIPTIPIKSKTPQSKLLLKITNTLIFNALQMHQKKWIANSINSIFPPAHAIGIFSSLPIAQIWLIDYFCIVKCDDTIQQRIRTIYRTPQFEEFFNSLSDKVQTKFKYVIDVITSIYNIPTKFVKHLQDTDLYEMRVSVGTNEYRTILFATDKENVIEATNIILLSGFLKKSSKDYDKQIIRALSILEKFELWDN